MKENMYILKHSVSTFLYITQIIYWISLNINLTQKLKKKFFIRETKHYQLLEELLVFGLNAFSYEKRYII